jgi:hypothetical protein
VNAAETIAAAIEKLEGLQDDSTPGPWRIVRDSLQGSRRDYDPLLEAGDYAASGETFNNPDDPRLIVTLHRTIDAILAILRTTLSLDGLVPVDQALALAHAVLGDDS